MIRVSFELTGYICRRAASRRKSAEPGARGGVGPAQLFYSANRSRQVTKLALLTERSVPSIGRLAIVPDNVETRANREEDYVSGKGTPGPSTRQSCNPRPRAGCIRSAADTWFFARWLNAISSAERALVALGGQSMVEQRTPIILSHSLVRALARMPR